MQGKLLSGGAFKDKSCRKDLFSGGACKKESFMQGNLFTQRMRELFSGSAFKDKSCRKDVLSGDALKDK